MGLVIMKHKNLIYFLLSIVSILAIINSCKKDEQMRPKAEFTANNYYISLNDTVKFINSSLNATSYLWHFTNGSPEYSIEKNPEVIYKKIGKFAVSLKVSNVDGSDSIKKDSLIIVDYTYAGVVNEGIIYKNLTGDSIMHKFFNIDLNKDGVNDIKFDCSNG